ncbi:hypothetical protein EDB81DRAFT_669134 [Dactylonectria macrodidyma]|uniref:DUF676 domain-containing protein n=1 Tax=Dactylonectria macrodidyma TaxID=307937 RepID=A0A9P9DAM7_9HYPO|nr:hypothetical protein EDB81DRAFT_669134 [Dactylonectria macrodidyma]
MPEIHRIGFTQLGSEEGRDVSIIFVHGLRGHPQATWSGESHGSNETDISQDVSTSKRKFIRALFRGKRSGSAPSNSENGAGAQSSDIFWPDRLLTQDIPKARIWTYGYNADVIEGMFRANNLNSVSQHGRDLAVKLEREVENEDPIIFVAHSLGGIIVKDAIFRSEVCRQRTKLIVFLGTPHRGSSYADWAQIASRLACLALQHSNQTITRALEVNSEVLDRIHEGFTDIAHASRIKVHSFQEGHGVSGVVGDFSSKLDLPRELETVETIDADHRQMVKCASRDDARYRAISGVLKQFLRSGALDGTSATGQQLPSAHAGGQRQELPSAGQTPSGG